MSKEKSYVAFIDTNRRSWVFAIACFSGSDHHAVEKKHMAEKTEFGDGMRYRKTIKAIEQDRQHWMRGRDGQPATAPALSSEHGWGTTPNHEPWDHGSQQ